MDLWVLAGKTCVAASEFKECVVLTVSVVIIGRVCYGPGSERERVVFSCLRGMIAAGRGVALQPRSVRDHRVVFRNIRLESFSFR